MPGLMTEIKLDSINQLSGIYISATEVTKTTCISTKRNGSCYNLSNLQNRRRKDVTSSFDNECNKWDTIIVIANESLVIK